MAKRWCVGLLAPLRLPHDSMLASCGTLICGSTIQVK